MDDHNPIRNILRHYGFVTLLEEKSSKYDAEGKFKAKYDIDKIYEHIIEKEIYTTACRRAAEFAKSNAILKIEKPNLKFPPCFEHFLNIISDYEDGSHEMETESIEDGTSHYMVSQPHMIYCVGNAENSLIRKQNTYIDYFWAMHQIKEITEFNPLEWAMFYEDDHNYYYWSGESLLLINLNINSKYYGWVCLCSDLYGEGAFVALLVSKSFENFIKFMIYYKDKLIKFEEHCAKRSYFSMIQYFIENHKNMKYKPDDIPIEIYSMTKPQRS